MAAISVHVIKPSIAWTKTRIDFHGIPYHQSDASTGTWMGITRTTTPEFRADYKFYSAQRPLLDMDNPFYKRLNNARRTLLMTYVLEIVGQILPVDVHSIS